ncbi:hypothetical protein BLOT_010450 [Blomia tropicalis]|nr:hypothetical protein BLOT_010450 [Blomia tropicalis]
MKTNRVFYSFFDSINIYLLVKLNLKNKYSSFLNSKNIINLQLQNKNFVVVKMQCSEAPTLYAVVELKIFENVVSFTPTKYQFINQIFKLTFKI